MMPVWLTKFRLRRIGEFGFVFRNRQTIFCATEAAQLGFHCCLMRVRQRDHLAGEGHIVRVGQVRTIRHDRRHASGEGCGDICRLRTVIEMHGYRYAAQTCCFQTERHQQAPTVL